MPDEYISREAAEILMCDACEYHCKYHERVSGRSLITADGCRHLRDLYDFPAADVAPVVHAHWGRGSEDGRRKCSHCGMYEHERNYCGFCGAYMDESEDE